MYYAQLCKTQKSFKSAYLSATDDLSVKYFSGVNIVKTLFK